MYKDIITGFIVGSSWSVFLLFFIGFARIKDNINNGNCIHTFFDINSDIYYLYTIFAPLYLGIMTAFAIFIHKFFNLPLNYCFILIAIISSIFVSVFITLCNIYDYDPDELNRQYLNIILSHFVAYAVIAATIYKLIK